MLSAPLAAANSVGHYQLVQGQELVDEVMVRPRSAFVVFPGVTCIDRPDWHQITTPSLKDGGLNGVSLAVLAEADVDRVIDETIAGYEAEGIAFRWTVGPHSRPSDLGPRLEKRGLKAVRVAGMAGTFAGETGDPDIEVEVVGPDTLDEFNDLMMRGWNMQSTVLCDYNAHVLRESPAVNPFFIARIAGQGVGVASYHAFASSIYLVGGVVLPGFRKRGVYRTLVRARQEHANQSGISLATCHAMMESSAPVLAKLGFQRVCEFTSYINR
jgi:GNAT superfamily N-acetyltransferase